MQLNDIELSSCLYISGQMSGLPDLGKSLLDSTESAWREVGFKKIINPYDMVDQSSVPTWSDCMRIDIKEIFTSDVKAMLLIDNWKNSKGATLEVILFLSLGIPIFHYDSGSNITSKTFSEFTQEFLYDKFQQMVMAES